MKKLSNTKLMHSVINELGMTGKPFSLHDIYKKLAAKGVNPENNFRAVIEDYMRNMLDQNFILVVGNSEPSPHSGLFQASELFLDLGNITPNCIEDGVNLSALALRLTLSEFKKK